MELSLVISLALLLGWVTLGPIPDLRQNIAIKDAQATVFYALEEGRNKATTGVGTTEHGVYVAEDRVVLFEGDTYVGSGEVKMFPFGISSNQTGISVVFSRLIGTSSVEDTITLSHASGKTKNVYITYDGIISQ